MIIINTACNDDTVAAGAGLPVSSIPAAVHDPTASEDHPLPVSTPAPALPSPASHQKVQQPSLDHDTDVANAMALVPTPTGLEAPDQEADMLALLEGAMPDLSFMLSDTPVTKGAAGAVEWSSLP